MRFLQFLPDVLSLQYFISIQKILDELNHSYITPIRQILRTRPGAWGWFSFAEWLTAKGCFAAPWREIFSGTLSGSQYFPVKA